MRWLPDWLVPSRARSLPGQRWLNIALRTLHLCGIAGIGGGFLYAADAELWRGWLWLTLLSGLGLVALSVWSEGVWLLQVRGQAVMLKLLLLAAVDVWPQATPWLFLLVIVISSVVAHAPGRVRYYSVWHGRRIDQQR
ncbi:hypothetical protein [Plasticicumulans acidivorans]|uniref:Uncharacterized protein n=1 Tax=Plasticicumulans acidivorans TaxID=886464 RepID=A0A317MYG2_9GAMM|nr:hypothetical protein [Plasticicumulans acidivorans]PWV64471.1 hypothetical protein C7443_102120 [Plasticicumulans acidivorans]